MLGRKKNLEGILSSFHKVIEDLRLLQDENSEKVFRNNAVIHSLTSENAVLDEESKRAEAVEEKLNALVS